MCSRPAAKMYRSAPCLPCGKCRDVETCRNPPGRCGVELALAGAGMREAVAGAGPRAGRWSPRLRGFRLWRLSVDPRMCIDLHGSMRTLVRQESLRAGARQGVVPRNLNQVLRNSSHAWGDAADKRLIACSVAAPGVNRRSRTVSDASICKRSSSSGRLSTRFASSSRDRAVSTADENPRALALGSRDWAAVSTR